MEVFPGDQFTVAEVQSWIDELLNVGLLAAFSVPDDSTQEYAGQHFWCVTGWHHQRIDKPSNKYPDPEKFLDRSRIIRRTFQDQSCCKGKESIGVEGKGEESNTNARVKKTFVKPTLDEVTAYCRERANRVDPSAWLAHYEANGWKIGRNPMKDWRAAVRTWEHGRPGDPPKSKYGKIVPIEILNATYNPIDGGAAARGEDFQ
jgi:hypothetical protein